MKVSFEWLGSLVPISLSPQELAERLTLSGLQVEACEGNDSSAVLTIAITPNRGDCLSMLGLAREIAALTDTAWHHPYPVEWFEAKQAGGEAKVEIIAKEQCRRYCCQIVADVEVGPSPEWVVRRLEAMGIRSINNVVDATNYVMLESGQPLHAFDADLLTGDTLMVRLAKKGESLITLDGKERRLNPADLVIADTKRAVALAGVMGGHESEVSSKTKRLFLESAWFEPASVRKTSKRFGLSTESSYRFERQVDWYQVRAALSHLIEILQEHAAARPLGTMTDTFVEVPLQRTIALDQQHVQRLSGMQWSPDVIENSLTPLGFALHPTGSGAWSVTVPSYRPDIVESVDLIEELVRLRGFDDVTPRLPQNHLGQIPHNPKQQLRHRLKTHLASLGFNEVLQYSFCPAADVHWLGESWSKELLHLANPLSQGAAVLRPTLLPSLLRTAHYHEHRQMEELRFFELRPVFRLDAGKLKEEWHLAGLLAGPARPGHWSLPKRPIDFYETKGVVEVLLDDLVLGPVRWEELGEGAYAKLLHPGISAALHASQGPIGVLGALHPAAAEYFGLEGVHFLFELGGAALQWAGRPEQTFRPYSLYPHVHRDLAIVVSEAIPAEAARALIRAADPQVIQGVELFDVYRGAQVPAGMKSLAFRIRCAAVGKTLIDKEVDKLYDKIIESLKKQLQATPR